MGWLNRVASRLDKALQAAAAKAGLTYVNTYDAFGGNELCQADPYLNYLTVPLVDSFHPTEGGQAILAGLAIADLPPGTSG